MFSQFDTVAQIKKLSSYSSGKASYSSASGAIEGFFTPMAPDMQVQALGIESQAYQFVTDQDQDIDANDILVIDSVSYGVKGISLYRQGSVTFLKAICELSIKT